MLEAFGLQFHQLEKFFINFKDFSLWGVLWNTQLKLTNLQWSLFKLLSILLFLTTLLILYSWKLYGKVITDKFVRPSTLKEIEELKLSVAKLKLPKEHSPRI